MYYFNLLLAFGVRFCFYSNKVIFGIEKNLT